jgi:L-amino acid N-acyltransferase YncA
MTDSLLVRPAVIGDAPGIAAVHVQSWRETYAAHLPAQVLADLDESEFAARWATNLQSTTIAIWVAVIGAKVVGWASVSAGRDAEQPTPLELEGIYVVASQHGTGAGQDLLDGRWQRARTRLLPTKRFFS